MPTIDKKLYDFVVDRVKGYEGCKLTPYWDVDAYSIGYGHHYRPSETPPSQISQDEAERLLAIDMENKIAEARSIPIFNYLNRARRAALIDMVYNMGITKVNKFKETFEHMQNGEWEDVYKHIMATPYAQQVPRRATSNATLFRVGYASGLEEQPLEPQPEKPDTMVPHGPIPEPPKSKSLFEIILDLILSIFGGKK